MSSDAFSEGAAFFQEVTQGTPPADGTAWNSDGRRLAIIAGTLDISQIVQASVEDERAQETIFGLNRKTKGLKNNQASLGTYGTGSGADTDAATQISETILMTLLEHELGGLHRSNQTVLAGGGHTTTVVNVTANTNLALGCMVFIHDTSTGTQFLAMVVGIASLAITLDMACPFTPVDGDIMLATGTVYIDETVLVDSTAGPTTFSWLFQKGFIGGPESWQVMGSKAQLDSIELSRGAQPRLMHTIMGASFVGPDDAPTPTWSAGPEGVAPFAVGPTSECNLQDYGTTTYAEIHTNTVEIAPGVPVIRDETNTEVDDNMEGTYGYSTGPADTLITLNIAPWSDTHIDKWQADTYRFWRWFKKSSEGGLFGVHCPRVEIAQYPGRGVTGGIQSSQVVLRAHPNTTTVATTQLWRSKIKIAIA